VAVSFGLITGTWIFVPMELLEVLAAARG